MSTKIQNDFSEIKIEESLYPLKLKAIRYPPKILYCRGNIDIFKNQYFLAVVGTRNMTAYGRKALENILPAIAKRKIVIVSGLAIGIDILAHKMALDNDCPTIAVLAGGLDKIYPTENKKYAEEIVAKNGLLISEHPLGSGYLRQHFVARNRIISGLADAVVVAEAGSKSGALITAEFAFREKKRVFSLPGNIFSPESRGANNLLRKEAKILLDERDIIEYFFPDSATRKRSKKNQNKSSNKEKLISLTKNQKLIFDFLSFDISLSLNEIIKKSQLNSAEVITIISQLELKDLVESVGGSRYIRS